MILAILAIIILILLIMLQKHRESLSNFSVNGIDGGAPSKNHNPMYEEALGDLPTTPKTPKEIRFQNMYSE